MCLLYQQTAEGRHKFQKGCRGYKHLTTRLRHVSLGTALGNSVALRQKSGKRGPQVCARSQELNRLSQLGWRLRIASQLACRDGLRLNAVHLANCNSRSGLCVP